MTGRRHARLPFVFVLPRHAAHASHQAGSHAGGSTDAPFESAAGATLSSAEDWLKYYSECRQYLVIMGQKFTALLGQASIFSFAAVTGIFTLNEKLRIGFPENLWLAMPSAIGLSMYLVIIVKYFLQVRTTGALMRTLEAKFLAGQEDTMGLIHSLRGSGGAFYGKTWTLLLTWAYAIILVLLPLLASYVVPTGPVAQTRDSPAGPAAPGPATPQNPVTRP